VTYYGPTQQRGELVSVGANEPNRGLFSVAGAIISFAVVRLASVVGVYLMFTSPGKSPRTFIFGDITWYISIATDGYHDPAPGRENEEQVNLAFFPLFPMLMKPLIALGIPPFVAGMIVASAASLVAAWAIFGIGEFLYGKKVGYYLVLAWAVVPPASLVLNLPMSESVFTACAALTLLFLLRGNMLAAAGMAVLAGLARPSAVAVIAAVGWAALVNLFRGRKIGTSLLAMVIAPLGFLGYLAYVASKTHRLDGWFRVQSAWDSRFDFGFDWFKHIATWFSEPPDRQLDIVTLITALCALALLIALIALHPPGPIIMFTAVSLILIFGQSHYPDQIQRFVVPIFPLLIPLAVLLARMAWPLAVALLATALALTTLQCKYLAERLPTRVNITDFSMVGDRDPLSRPHEDPGEQAVASPHRSQLTSFQYH
jgi:hypothetical protein